MNVDVAIVVIRNAAFVGGLIMLFIGLWWERPAAALIVTGLALAAAGAWSARGE